MKRYTLVVKRGWHHSGWGLRGWMREKLGDVYAFKSISEQDTEWTVYVDTADDLTDRLNAWFCEPSHAPFPAGTLLYWNSREPPSCMLTGSIVEDCRHCKR